MIEDSARRITAYKKRKKFFHINNYDVQLTLYQEEFFKMCILSLDDKKY